MNCCGDTFRTSVDFDFLLMLFVVVVSCCLLLLWLFSQKKFILVSEMEMARLGVLCDPFSKIIYG